MLSALINSGIYDGSYVDKGCSFQWFVLVSSRVRMWAIINIEHIKQNNTLSSRMEEGGRIVLYRFMHNTWCTCKPFRALFNLISQCISFCLIHFASNNTITYNHTVSSLLTFIVYIYYIDSINHLCFGHRLKHTLVKWCP